VHRKAWSFSRSEVTFLLAKAKYILLGEVPEATFLRGCPSLAFICSAASCSITNLTRSGVVCSPCSHRHCTSKKKPGKIPDFFYVLNYFQLNVAMP
jgi:hypothetical protein